MEDILDCFLSKQPILSLSLTPFPPLSPSLPLSLSLLPLSLSLSSCLTPFLPLPPSLYPTHPTHTPRTPNASTDERSWLEDADLQHVPDILTHGTQNVSESSILCQPPESARSAGDAARSSATLPVRQVLPSHVRQPSEILSGPVGEGQSASGGGEGSGGRQGDGGRGSGSTEWEEEGLREGEEGPEVRRDDRRQEGAEGDSGQSRTGDLQEGGVEGETAGEEEGLQAREGGSEGWCGARGSGQGPGEAGQSLWEPGEDDWEREDTRPAKTRYIDALFERALALAGVTRGGQGWEGGGGEGAVQALWAAGSLSLTQGRLLQAVGVAGLCVCVRASVCARACVSVCTPMHARMHACEHGCA